MAILQEYYDMEADEAMREKALLVFNQSYVTNTGVSISIDGKPFEVVASMSGTVEEVITDVFKGMKYSNSRRWHANRVQFSSRKFL